MVMEWAEGKLLRPIEQARRIAWRILEALGYIHGEGAVHREITPELQEIVYRAMERDPKNRYPNAREFAHDLEHPERVGGEHRELLWVAPHA